ncbi:MAG: alpha/beta fold hydrolase [Bacteroidota bacterium]
MKRSIPLLFLLMFSSLYSPAQMTQQHISTQLDSIAVHQRVIPNTVPVLFLHGVYFDHQLWQQQMDQIQHRTVIALDMPLHGNSGKQIPTNWTLEDCAAMLLEVLDSLEVPQVIAIGHSWGSMTILRAAHQQPERFLSVGLGNMPFEATTTGAKWQFRFQHLMLPFRQFYAKQAAKSLFGKASLLSQPTLADQLKRPMSLLTNGEIKAIDRTVILQATDSRNLIEELPIPAIGLKGEADYVPISEAIPYRIIPGGHISPLEEPEAVSRWIQEVIHLAESPLTR